MGGCAGILGIEEPVIEPSEAGSTDGPVVTDAVTVEADAAVVDAPPDGPCPSRGGAMVSFGTFCIDATEVSVASYNEFALLNIASTRAECPWNTSQQLAVSTQAPNDPVRYVNWCQAATFCEWAGKHLCGALTGVPGGDHKLATAAYRDPAASEHMAACTNRGARPYPYGATFQPTACNVTVDDSGTGAVEPSTLRAACEGGRAGVFAILGNVWEWTDSCVTGVDSGGPEKDLCYFMGGSYMSVGDVACGRGSGSAREFVGNDVGFRCCY